MRFVNFIGDVHFGVLFSVSFNTFLETVNINRLVSTLRRRRSIFFLDSEISYSILEIGARSVFTTKNVCASCFVCETFLPKWRLRELPTAAGFSVI
jgi:hypothetical protein